MLLMSLPRLGATQPYALTKPSALGQRRNNVPTADKSQLRQMYKPHTSTAYLIAAAAAAALPAVHLLLHLDVVSAALLLHHLLFSCLLADTLYLLLPRLCTPWTAGRSCHTFG